MAFDIDSLLTPISDDAPCGEELRYHPAFQELQRALEPQVHYEQIDGREIARTRPPEWPDIHRSALDLTAHGRDLRLLLVLLRSLVGTRGIVGALDGLRLIRLSLERYWDQLHPRLDEEAGDPAEQAFHRINCLKQLVDSQALLAELRRAPLAEARGLGRVSLREIELATGRAAPVADEPPPDAGVIEALFAQADAEELAATETAIGEADREAAAIAEALEARLGADGMARAEFRLDELHATLAAMAREIRTRRPAAATRGNGADPAPAEATPAAAPEAPVAAGTPPTGATQATPGPSGGLGRVETRDDVVRALDLILDYYRRKEPSSPVPLLVQRTRRLVPMSFLEALEELAPAGVAQVREIGGIDRENG